MTIHMDLREFQLELEKLIKKMIEAKLIPGLTPSDHAAIAKLAKNVTETLHKNSDINLSKDDIYSNDSREVLALACQAQFVQQKNPNFKFDYTLLFKNQIMMTDDQKLQLKKDLTLELTKLFTEMSKFYPHPTPGGKKKLEELAELLAEKLMDKGRMQENSKLLALVFGCQRQLLLDDKQTEQRRELYGVDTHNTGAVFLPVPAPVEGNKQGLLDMAFQGGTSFMGELLNANPDQPDPIGIKMVHIIADIGSGALSGDLEQRLMADHIIDSPSPAAKNWPPKMVPPGYQTNSGG